MTFNVQAGLNGKCLEEELCDFWISSIGTELIAMLESKGAVWLPLQVTIGREEHITNH